MPQLCYDKGMKRGRPPKPPGEAATEALPPVRLTPAVMMAVKAHSAARGVSMSEYVRRAVEVMNERESALSAKDAPPCS